MTQQPGGQPGGQGQQPWPPTAQQPWDAGRQPQRQAPPIPQAFAAAPARGGNPVVRLSIWRLAIGIWLGSMLVFITGLILAIVLGAAFSGAIRDAVDNSSTTSVSGAN